jgi:Ala-tRNA(Pro) deacylase
MPVKILKEFLDQNRVKYVSIVHSRAYTAQEVAASAHVPGKAMAKVVIVDLDGRMAMAVLPADRKVVLQDLRELTGSDQVRFAAEEQFKALFPDCEIGAMPPFGNLYGMEVYAAESLAENAEIAFNAGSHTEIIKMRFADFERLVQPLVVAFTT